MFNVTATTINFGQAATTISIGATTGSTTIRNLISSTLGISGGPATHTTGTFSGAVSATGFQTSSDVRLKTNIIDSSYGLDTVLQLRSVKYTKDGKTEVGLIAQEVETIIPEFVGQQDDGMKTVNYGQMVSVLIKAVQELKAEVDTLKARLGE